MDNNTPSRYIGFAGKFYTVADFLNPDISLDLTAKSMAGLLSSNGNNLQKAFGDYNGSGASGNYAADSIKLYNICKNSASPSGPTN